MSKENKTKVTQVDVPDFIAMIENETRRDDARRLVDIFSKTTGYNAHMFGPTIIGFGSYHYKYASGREGDAPVAAFSPRKDNIVFYFSAAFDGRERLLEQLGKHKVGKGCVYVKKLADADLEVLEKMIVASVSHIKKMYP